MMSKTRFVDCYWGSDFNSTAGFDVLCKRLRDGKQMCQEFEELIKQRAEAEERYGKSLTKIARTGETGIEIGTLKESWDVLRQETENCGLAHIEFAKQLVEQLEKTAIEFREEQKNKRKPVEETIKKVQKNKKACFDNHMKSKRNYETKCREHDSCKEMLVKSAAQQSKDEEKLRKNLARAKTAVENTDTNYQSTVKHLEESRKEWEREMTICCNTFQELEQERISFLRNSMWTYTNLGSGLCVKNDEYFEDVRKSLEHCDVDSDIRLFISKSQTGSEKPGQIHYANFYTEQSNLKSGFTGTHPPSMSRINVQTRQGSLPPTPSTIQRNARDLDDDIEEDPTYSTVNEALKQPKQPPPNMVRAEFDYMAQGDEELSLREGDLIKVIRMEDLTWWFGELRGKTGMFPKDFVSFAK